MRRHRSKGKILGEKELCPGCPYGDWTPHHPTHAYCNPRALWVKLAPDAILYWLSNRGTNDCKYNDIR